MKQKHYEDFELWIDPVLAANTEYPFTVKVMGSPVGGYVEEPLRLDLGKQDFQDELEKVFSEGFDLPAREQFGRRLYQALFHGDVGGVWNQSLGRVEGDENVDGLRLRLTINEPQLAMLPWELIFDEKLRFLANAANQAVSRYLPVPEPARLRITDKLRILLVVASPKDFPPISEQEAVQLQTAILGLSDRFDCQLLYNQSKDHMRGELQNGYHVLHFLGHGKPGKLLLCDDNGNADILADDQFAHLVHGRSAHLRLVILNACSSSQALEQQLFSGIGPALVQMRIAAVVAMQYADVNIETAISFNKAFYQALANENPVDVAVNEARGALSTSDLLKSRDWSTPVLYMSTRSGRILNFVGKEGDELEQLKILAQESEEARAAVIQLELSLSDVKTRTDKLRDWKILERNLRDLQSVSDGFASTVKGMARYASRPEWIPREMDQNTLELFWKQCAKGIDELDKEVSADSPLREMIGDWREQLNRQRTQIEKSLAESITHVTRWDSE